MSKKNKGNNPKQVIADNSAMANAFDAATKTEKGQIMVFEAKSIGTRVSELRELSYDTIMELPKGTKRYKGMFYQYMEKRRRAGEPMTYLKRDKNGKTVPAEVKHPYDLFQASKPVLKKIAVNGGDEYDLTTVCFQYTWASEKALADTVTKILG